MSYARPIAAPRRRVTSGPLSWIAAALAVRRQRQALAALSPEHLDDIGVSPETARREAEQPIWNVPAHWLR